MLVSLFEITLLSVFGLFSFFHFVGFVGGLMFHLGIMV